MLYQPHDYQKYATRFIVEHPIAAVLLQMGLGKSVITLTAIAELVLERFEVCRVLVIAPLRVARDTWPAEIQKWDHLKGLTYSVAVGTEAERIAALRQNTLIHIINRENVQWLIEQSGLPFQYDMLVIDELSSFKSHQAKRFRALMRMRPRVARVVGLTGTPSSNGLMDLWAEFRLLDKKTKSQCYTEMRNVAQAEYANGCDLPTVTLKVDFINCAETEEYRDYYRQNSPLPQATRINMQEMGEHCRAQRVSTDSKWNNAHKKLW